VEDERKTKGELLRELRDLRRHHANADPTHTDTSRSPAYPPSGETFFRSLIENALDIITVLDANGSFLYQSPNIEQLLGYLPEELIGKSSFEYIHPEDRSRSLSDFRCLRNIDLLRSPVVAYNLFLGQTRNPKSWILA